LLSCARQECGWDVQTASLGPDGGERSGVGVELGEDVFDVGGDGALADGEALGDSGVVPAGDQQAEYLELAVGQPEQVAAR
jgi:hypothetical protein